MQKIDFRLYLITDRSLLPREALQYRLESLVKAGIKAIQIREKDLSARDILALAQEIRKLPAKLFINDRADIAYAAKADGLHIPEHGFPIDEVRKIIGQKTIGKSTHSLESALRAETEGADFITFGPIYNTPSKRKFGKPLGIDKLKEVTLNISIPVFAIGGINPERVKECQRAGAFGVAVISDLLLAANPELQVKKYKESLGAL
jgi:thiamine-phosphate pyrophosphorylase